MASPPPPPLAPLLLAGATAVGKSAVALLLAERLGGEIISVDSMQVYRGMDIGTAKPSLELQRRVAHHLIDVVDITEPFDAAQFARLAHAIARKVQARGRIPILCGGTGLYFKAYLEGLGTAPAGDPVLRKELESTPLADLLKELKQCDPTTFETIDRKNPRRVVRALEVIRSTGKPFSDQRAPWEATPDPGGVSECAAGCWFFGLEREAADLHARIDARVEEMFARGLVGETEALLARGLEQNRTAMQAIGYRQVVEHLHGQPSLAETIELVKLRTRQFAKRQRTWFRHQTQLAWLQVSPQATAEEISELLVRRMNESPPGI